jgi:hypothetical protein
VHQGQRVGNAPDSSNPLRICEQSWCAFLGFQCLSSIHRAAILSALDDMMRGEGCAAKKRKWVQLLHTKPILLDPASRADMARRISKCPCSA